MNPSPQSPMKNQGSRSFMDMTPEQIKEMMSKIEIIPCPEYDETFACPTIDEKFDK